jgi:hypothetical protein
MPRQLPPIDKRFPVNRKDHTQKGPYLKSLIRKCLEKKIKYEDPDTNKIIKGKVKDAIIWRLILNATEGDNTAIKEILDRIDGKVVETKEIDIPNAGEYFQEIADAITRSDTNSDSVLP